MNLNEYQNLANRTAKPLPTQIDNLNHALYGMTSETGEFADAMKKHVIYGKPLDTENLKEELGDLMWYIALAATALNTDLSIICEENIDKLRKRYPEKYTDAHAIARADKVQEMTETTITLDTYDIKPEVVETIWEVAKKDGLLSVVEDAECALFWFAADAYGNMFLFVNEPVEAGETWEPNGGDQIYIGSAKQIMSWITTKQRIYIRKS